MKITSVQTVCLRCDLQVPFSYSQKWFQRRTGLLVRIETDEGLVGWGESFCHDAWPALQALIERVFAPLLIGRDPLAREVLWQLLYNWSRDYGQKGLTAAAISGIDVALWDLAGKTAGLPVYALLGGPFADKVPVYATGMYQTAATMADVGILVDEAEGYVAQGFGAVKVKVGFGVARDVANVTAVRQAVGPEIGLMVDANHAYDAATAIRLGRALGPLGIGWFEEPVAPEDYTGYQTVRAALDIPIAGGEAEFTRYGFRELLSRGCVDIAQPDINIAGGISETRRIETLASVYGVRCVPHVWGTGVALATGLHLIAAMAPQPGALNTAPIMLEYDRSENPMREVSLTEPLTMCDGALSLPPGPGLGIEVNLEALAPYIVR